LPQRRHYNLGTAEFVAISQGSYCMSSFTEVVPVELDAEAIVAIAACALGISARLTIDCL